MIAANALDTFTETGFQAALVQKEKHVDSHLNTAWTINVIRGFVIFVILFFAAPFIASFFNTPATIPIIQVVACSSFISGCKNIGIVYFQKDLSFKKYYTLEVPSTLIDLSISIFLAFLLQNVWALALGGLVGNMSRCILSYILHPYRPHLSFNRTHFHDLFRFGKWILLSAILLFLISNSADIFIGKIVGMTALGLFQMAGVLAYLTTSEIAYVVSQVTFPAFAKLQNNIILLKTNYLKTIQISYFVIVLITAEFLVLARDFTTIFLNEKWLPIVPIIEILLFASLFTTLGTISAQILNAVGKPKRDSLSHVIRYIVLASLLYPLYYLFGLKGVALAVLISVLFYTSIIMLSVVRILQLRYSNFAANFIIPSINACLTGGFVYSVRYALPQGIVSFIFCAIAGFVFYVFLALIASKFFHIDYFTTIKDMHRAIREVPQ